MYIPRDVIMYLLGFITLPIVAYIYYRYDEYKKKKKVNKEDENNKENL